MKKVLILSYYFPPYEYSGGHRVFGWYKNLKKNQIYPTVVTRHWDINIQNSFDFIKASSKQQVELTDDTFGTIIRVPFNPDLRDRHYLQRKNSVFGKLFNLQNKLRFFSFKIDKTAGIYHEADKFLENNRYDLIIATGGPFILFRYAHLLSAKHKVSWIADYRDGWSTNSSLIYSGFLKRTIYKFALKIIEKKYVKNATAIITAAEPYEEMIKTIFPLKKTAVVYNGYDPDLIKENECDDKGPPDSSRKRFFTIAYAGTIYPFQEIEIFLEGYLMFVNEIKDCNSRLVFYGLKYDKKQCDRLMLFHPTLNQYIITTDLLNKKELLRKMSEASAFLLLSNNKIKTLASKLFDYLVLTKKIILVPDDTSIMGKIIQECSAGITCSTPAEVKNELIILYNEFKLNNTVFSQTNYFEKYSWENQVKNLSKIIHSLSR